MSALLGTFAKPNTDTTTVTVKEFYTMVEALAQVLKEIHSKDESSFIKEYLTFMENLKKDVELLNETKESFDIKSVLDKDLIEKVNRLWSDYISDSNEVVFAKIRESLNEVGFEESDPVMPQVVCLN